MDKVSLSDGFLSLGDETREIARSRRGHPYSQHSAEEPEMSEVGLLPCGRLIWTTDGRSCKLCWQKDC